MDPDKSHIVSAESIEGKDAKAGSHRGTLLHSPHLLPFSHEPPDTEAPSRESNRTRNGFIKLGLRFKSLGCSQDPLVPQ